MHDLWTNWRADLKRYDISKPQRSLQQASDHVLSGLDKHECEWLVKEIYPKDPHKVAEKVFKSKSRSQIIDFRGGVKPKDIKGLYSTRVELEVELNATRRKNEILIDRLATIEAENEKLQNRVESVETEMMKIKDLVFQQFDTRSPSTLRDGHGTSVDTRRHWIFIPTFRTFPLFRYMI